MRNINGYIFIGVLVFSPLAPAHATVNVYTNDNAAGPTSVEVANLASTTEEERSKTKYIDTGSAKESAAGPAILEIDPVEGDPDHAEREGVIQYNESDLDFAQINIISAEAREIRGWDEKKKNDFLETVKEYSQVKSEQELENFAKGVLLKDENMKSIQTGEDSVEIEYEMPARFLNIFNASLVVRAEVASGRLVKIKYPWLSFLFKKFVVTSDIESEVKASLPEIGDEVLVSFEARALAIKILSNIMKNKHDTVKNSSNIR